MKIFEADDRKRLEFLTKEDDKLFAQRHQITYLLMNRHLQDGATGNDFTEQLRTDPMTTAQLTDPDHLFYIAQKNVHVKNMKR